LRKYLKGLGLTPDTFDPEEVIGTEVLGSVGKGEAFGDPCNRVFEITLPD
jgi:hypothetical protein